MPRLGASCLCAWNEYCEICSQYDFSSGPNTDYRARVTLPPTAIVNDEFAEMAAAMGEAIRLRMDEDILRLFYAPPSMIMGRPGRNKKLEVYRDWKTLVVIPNNSPAAVYRAFLEMMIRVSKLSRIPKTATWKVTVRPAYHAEVGNDASSHILEAYWTAENK